MRRAGIIVEGLILSVIGAYMGLLVLFGDYWRVMNPKYKWLTGATALMFLIVGISRIFARNGRPRVSRIIIFLFFIRILFRADVVLTLVPHAASSYSADSAEKEVSRVTVAGIQYVRINLAELFTFCSNEPKESSPSLSDKTTAHYVTRGTVRRSPELDRLGQFALVRRTVFCCVADSVTMGFRVQCDHPERFTDGQWVEVYGTLEPKSQETARTGILNEDSLMALNDSQIFIPDKVTPIGKPEVTFIFEIRTEEPYAY